MAQHVAQPQREARPIEERPDEVVFRTRELRKVYGQRAAVNNLNMEVRRGEIFGFLGPNGAGKTTTIRMALGLITPTSGQVEFFGKNVIEHRAEVLPRVGALIEVPALHLYLSGRDNLRAVSSVLGGVSRARIDEVLELVGLKGRAKDRVRTYSLGMKQRLGLAVALLNDPDMLVLDEPANGLDPAGIVEMRDLLRALAAQGKTIFISSHVLGEVQQLCTRVAIINLGHLITESSVGDLIQGHGSFAVRVESPETALRVIQAQPWGRDARLDKDGQLIATTPAGQGRHLVKALADAGIYPDSVSFQGESLEEVFLRMTSTDNNVQ